MTTIKNTTKRKAPGGAKDISFATLKITLEFNPVKNEEQPLLFPEEEQDSKAKTPHSDADGLELVHLSAIERQVYAYLEQPKMSEGSLMDKMHTRNWKQVLGVLHRLKAKGAINFFIENKTIYSEVFSQPSCREPNSVDLYNLPLSATRMYH